jgi:hypothetical protein
LASPVAFGQTPSCSESFSQIQSMIDADIKSGVPGRITAGTLNTLLNVGNDCYLNTESGLGLNVLPALQTNVGSSGTIIINGGALGTRSSGAPTNLTGLAILTGVSGLGTNVAASLARPSGDLRAMFTPGGTDNSSRAAAWLATNPQGPFTLTPSTNTSTRTDYYFSQQVSINAKGLRITCGGPGLGGDKTGLVFAAGVNGLVDTYNGGSEFEGCSIYSQGAFASYGGVTASKATITGVVRTLVTIPQAPFGVGDGVIVKGGISSDAALAVPPGASVASVSGSSITLASGFAPTSTPSNLAVIYRLPAALVASVTTTSGSSTVKVTGGTYAFQSGDVVWSDAFPWGTLVGNAVGPAGAQTLNMTTPYMTANQLATVTHTAGSGKMWLAPAGIKRLTTQRTRDMYVAGFPIGLEMACSGGNGNCTSSYDATFRADGAIIGRFTAGNNSGSSTEIGSLYAHNYRFDVLELGTVGSFYSGDSYNSFESGSSYASIAGNCQNQNYTGWFGVYLGYPGTQPTYCADATNPFLNANGAGNPASNIGMFITPTGGVPTGSIAYDTNGAINGAPVLFGRGASDCIWLGTGGGTPMEMVAHSCNASVDGYVFKYNSAWPAYMFTMGGTPYFPFFGFVNNNYTGYSFPDSVSVPVFPLGLLLSQFPTTTPGGERYIDYEPFIPSSETWRKQGDFAFNVAPLAGGSGCWHDVANGANWYPGCPVSNSATVPDYTMRTVRSGASGNTDLTGRVTLSTGAGSYSLTQTYASAPNCLCADVTTPANACSISESTTALTFTGTGSDVVKYICMGRN